VFSLELDRVLSVLAQASIPCVLLKGPALGLTAYPQPRCRFYSDLDVLIQRERLEAARTVLEAIGFESSATFRHASFYRQHHFHDILRSKAGLILELHWNLSRPTDYCQFDVGGVFDRSQIIRTSSGFIRVPSDLDQILHASCQALREGYDLRRVIDAALLMRHLGADDSAVTALANRQGMRSVLWLLLDLQHVLCGGQLPPVLERALRPPRLAHRCLNSLNLAERTLSLDLQQSTVLKRLTNWLCAPSAGTALIEVGRYLVPTLPQLLDGGHTPSDLPGIGRRIYLTLFRSWMLLKILGHQGWRLACHHLGR